jgi:PAP2 superfamily
MRLRRRNRRRFSDRREVALAFGCYAAYLLVRAVVVNRRGRQRAARNAARVVDLERRLRIHVEPELQALLLTRQRRVLAVLNVAYVSFNIVLTTGVLLRLYRLRHEAFHPARRATALGMLVAQPVFLAFPVEPPRKQDHLVDTMNEVSGVDLDSGPIVRLYNPIAAMPSIHMVFAICTSTAVLASSDRPVVRGIAWGYPPAVAFTVLVTANHYVLDVIAGAALAAAAVYVSR